MQKGSPAPARCKVSRCVLGNMLELQKDTGKRIELNLLVSAPLRRGRSCSLQLCEEAGKRCKQNEPHSTSREETSPRTREPSHEFCTIIKVQ